MKKQNLESPVKVNILIEKKQLMKLRTVLKIEGKGRTLSQFVRDSISEYNKEHDSG